MLRSVFFFVLAGLISVGIFYLVLHYRPSPTDVSSIYDSIPNPKENSKSVVDEAKQLQATLLKIPDKGIPLSSLGLSSAQKSALQKVGIDTQSFVVTKDMVACGTEKLGAERTDALLSGESPSLIEVTSLIPCLKESE